MNLFRITALAVAVSVTSGCATVKGWFDNEQTEQQQAKTETFKDRVQLPDGYAQPKRSNEFDVPYGPLMEEDAYVTSPSSVLAIFEGSWINEDDAHPAKIMVERPELVKDFPSFVEKGVQSFVNEKQFRASKTDTGYRVEQKITEETGFWFWKNDIEVESYVYDINMQFKPHGRSGEISVDTVSYDKTNEELATKLAPDLRQSALAIQSLNDLMLELDYLYRVELKKEQASLDVTLSLGNDVGGNTVIVSQQEISYVWSQIDDLIEELGFSIEEDDEDLYIMDLLYDREELSFWDQLFSSDYVNQLDLEPGAYELLLTSTTKGVHIKLRSKNGQMLNKDEMTQAYELLKALVEEEELEL